MKRKLLPLLALFILFLTEGYSQGQRYYDEVFTDVTITPDVVYGNNISVLTGSPVPQDLVMDVYEPTGDGNTERPVIVYLHTGSFLPILRNGTTTGSFRDSATVEMCKRFARRGYVAVSMDYRLGWNPLSDDQDVRTSTLLNAVYRSLQDAKSCVRFLRKSFANGNPYRINMDKISLVGQGSGGYVTLAYATINSYADYTIPKFFDFNTNMPYVDTTLSGDWNGHGGSVLNDYAANNPGYPENVSMIVNMGGALGDSSWLEAGQVPMICFHVPYDPFAPSGIAPCNADCPVIVPTTNDFVVNVCGSIPTERIANQLHLNDPFALKTYSDPYTDRASVVDFGYKGLFLFYTNPPIQAGPWEWWDCAALKVIAPFVGVSPGFVDTVCLLSSLTNPDMSKTKANHYIDTIQGFLAPRMVDILDLPTGIHEVGAYNNDITVSPNPASDYAEISVANSKDNIHYIHLFDVTGKLVKSANDLNSKQYVLFRNNLAPGMYLLKVGVGDQEAIKKIMLE